MLILQRSLKPMQLKVTNLLKHSNLLLKVDANFQFYGKQSKYHLCSSSKTKTNTLPKWFIKAHARVTMRTWGKLHGIYNLASMNMKTFQKIPNQPDTLIHILSILSPGNLLFLFNLGPCAVLLRLS